MSVYFGMATKKQKSQQCSYSPFRHCDFARYNLYICYINTLTSARMHTHSEYWHSKYPSGKQNCDCEYRTHTWIAFILRYWHIDLNRHINNTDKHTCTRIHYQSLSHSHAHSFVRPPFPLRILKLDVQIKCTIGFG